MEKKISPAPIRKTVTVKADPARAFEVFAHRMHDWSPAGQSLLGSRRDIVIEPRVGGRWFEVSEGGGEADWGKVLQWEPPRRMVLAWQLNASFRYDPELVTEVEVRFEDAGKGFTRVEFEHRNLDRFGARATEVEAMLDSEGGWSGSFELYTSLFAEGVK